MGRAKIARALIVLVVAGMVNARGPSAAAAPDGGAGGESGRSLVQTFEQIYNPTDAGAPPGSARESLAQGYRLFAQAANLPWDQAEQKRPLLEQADKAAQASGDATLIYRVRYLRAATLRQLGQNAPALALLEENVRLVQRAKLHFNAESAIGGHLAAVGDIARAVVSYRRGLETARRNRYDVANAERRLAVALMMANQFDEARQLLEEALLALARERVGEGAMDVFAPFNDVVPSLTDRMTADMMARNARLRAQLAAMGAPTDVAQGLPERFGAFERSRVHRWLDVNRLHEWAVASQGHPEEAYALSQAGRKALLDTTWFLDDTWLDHVTDRKPRPTAEVLATARLTARRLQATIVEYSPLFSLTPNLPVLNGNPPRLAGVTAWVIAPDGRFTQRQVQSDSALEALAAVLRDPNGTLAVVRGTDSQPKRPGSPTDRGFTLAGAPAVRATTDPLGDLYQLLIQPIDDLLPREAEARVVFVPRDELLLVPFAALTDRQGRQLVDRYAVSTAPGLDLLTDGDAKRADGRGTLVVEVSSGAAVSTIRDPVRHPLPPLPGAKAEAGDVARQLQARVLPSREAVKAEVMRRMGQAAVIHLAAHGLSDERSGLLSSIALAPAKPDDGLLSAREVMAMRLSADLVVLSACDTGRGALQGDAIYGLPRAFLTAGARTVLSSLWKAADEPTRLLVGVFYRELLGGTDKARALRRAMLATRRKYPAPANWAGFVLTGQPDLSGAAPAWKGTARAAAAIPWRRSLFPVPADARLVSDKVEGVTFMIPRQPGAVMAYYQAHLGAAGYTEQVKDREASGASFELSFARGPAEDLVSVLGLSVVNTLGPAESGDPELMVTVGYKRALPVTKRPSTPR